MRPRYGTAKPTIKICKLPRKPAITWHWPAKMEGKFDLAIDWLVKSYSILSKNNEVHKLNCQRYINLLAIRKKEIKRLEKQIRVKD